LSLFILLFSSSCFPGDAKGNHAESLENPLWDWTPLVSPADPTAISPCGPTAVVGSYLDRK
jgi:hypothetical protein